MILLYSILIGSLFGAGMYMLLRRSLLKIIIGLIILGHGANLLIFTASGLSRGTPPLIGEGKHTLEATYAGMNYADPLPQALILTAIVIGFGVIAFALALVHRVFNDLETDDTDDLKMTDT